jgi:hypothetical protein
MNNSVEIARLFPGIASEAFAEDCLTKTLLNYLNGVSEGLSPTCKTAEHSQSEKIGADAVK